MPSAPLPAIVLAGIAVKQLLADLEKKISVPRVKPMRQGSNERVTVGQPAQDTLNQLDGILQTLRRDLDGDMSTIARELSLEVRRTLERAFAAALAPEQRM